MRENVVLALQCLMGEKSCSVGSIERQPVSWSEFIFQFFNCIFWGMVLTGNKMFQKGNKNMN